MPGQAARKPSAGRARAGTQAGDASPVRAGFALLMLAAIDRAQSHNQRAPVPWFVIVEHLGLPLSAATTRDLRPTVDRLTAAGALTRSVRYGTDVWALTPAGRRRLTRARRAGQPLELPESPQHRAWRQARASAASEIDALRAQLRTMLQQASTLLELEPGSAEDWSAFAGRLRKQCMQLARATYCLTEWAEPDDARSDNDARLQAGTLT